MSYNEEPSHGLFFKKTSTEVEVLSNLCLCCIEAEKHRCAQSVGKSTSDLYIVICRQ